MMFVHSTSSGSQTAASELYKAGPLVATCALCSEASPVTEQEAVEIFSYPCHHPSIWSAIYRKTFLDAHNIRFKEIPGAGWADSPFLIETLCQTDRIGYFDTAY